jgi:putative component of membrane protein insertase Oxa1/YidC/SpoIIIJ protein YidD
MYKGCHGVLALLWLIAAVANGEPWGKDADLACRQQQGTIHAPQPCSTPLLGSLGEQLIAFHQQVISPCDGPRSHFLPSSSQYTLDAMRKYGFCAGVMMGCDRLMRENDDPWVYKTSLNSGGQQMKVDPVR